MKVLFAFLSMLAVAAAFAPAFSAKKTTVVLNAEMMDRKAFVSAAVMAIFGAATAANAMDQEFVGDPTEQWETGKPTAAAAAARKERFANARTQMNSNFAPIKRLTLERKSPVTRLDLNGPDYATYKKTFPGLYKKP